MENPAPGVRIEVEGYFGVESNIVGKTPEEMEDVLGFPKGYLPNGAYVFALLVQPARDQFVQAGSTFYPQQVGLIGVKKRAAMNFIPGAWLNQRLVKVAPGFPGPCPKDPSKHHKVIVYPRVWGPNKAEQWILRKCLPAIFVKLVERGKSYWP